MNDSIPPRAKRREYLNRLRKKARLRAEREYREQFFVHAKTYRVQNYRTVYSRFMFAQGKFFNGGCGVARCGLCDHFVPSYKYLRQHDQFDREYEDWLRGDFREPFE